MHSPSLKDHLADHVQAHFTATVTDIDRNILYACGIDESGLPLKCIPDDEGRTHWILVVYTKNLVSICIFCVSSIFVCCTLVNKSFFETQ